MSKEIWLGPVLGNNRERLLARCAEYVANGETDRLLYIAASHPLLELVTERLLDGKAARGVWGEFPVYLFRGFVRRVLSSALEAGSASRTPIDHEELPLSRSLISQIIKQLSAAGRLAAIKPLANRDGCVNTIASLIGEIQRAGKTPEEFRIAIETRADETATKTQRNREKAPIKSRTREKSSAPQTPRSQIDFDREVALIYKLYSETLDRFSLTEEDADQLRALQLLRADFDGSEVALPWLKDIDLLVLDGFFDFTPVQGEMLRQLIPAIPNVIVNLNHDGHNEEIFRPFDSTIEQLKSIAQFEIKNDNEPPAVGSELVSLREKLFNVAQVVNLQPHHASQPEQSQINNLRYKLFECSDRETEIRSIAKEIKRLVHQQGYELFDIGLVVRERTSYADTILHVFAEESIPCNLERRIEASEIPCVRACAKLFELCRDPLREHVKNPKASDIADLVKSGYFRVSAEDLSALLETFNATYQGLLIANGQNTDDDRLERLRFQLGIGHWSPDVLENVFAYVGSELRVDAWLARAEKLISGLPSPEAARAFVSGNEINQGDDAAAVVEREIPEDLPERTAPKTPSPIHPAAIAWTILIMQHLRSLIAALPAEGSPENLRTAVMLLLDRLEFSKQVTLPFFNKAETTDLSQVTLNVRGLECLRRAIAGAVRSFNYAAETVSLARASARAGTQNDPSLAVGLLPRIPLSNFIDEVERCLRSQSLSIGAGNRDGLRVLEATDVRGLRFRALLIAGMTEGGFPLRTSGDWLYPHDERERLRKHGVALEDISNETLLKEEHYFYQAACRATDRLYVTRPLTLDDGTETVASYYIEELRRAIAPATLTTETIRSDVDKKNLRDSSTSLEFATVLIRQHELGGRSGFPQLSETVFRQMISESELRGYLSPSARRRLAIEQERNGAWFGPFDGEISNRELRAMLSRHFGPEYVYSASSLSTYGKCAFRFFASRVLKLEPRNEAALDLPAIDAGKLLHEILRRFFTPHRREYLPSLDPMKLRQEMSEVADQVFKEHEALVPALNERIWKIDCEIRKLIVDQVLLYELRLQEKSNARGMRPTFFELAFGRRSDAADPESRADYLKMQRPNASETALIQGQIDRVDINAEDQLAIAYDYKLSQGARLIDIEAAREIQIPIYLAALEQLFVPGYELAGGGYYRLRPRAARLNQGLYRHAFADCTFVTGKNLHDDIAWQRIREVVRRRVWEFIDGMRTGDFRVRPSLGKQTCKFCEYTAVCRYDTYRISRKRASSGKP